MFVFGPEGNNKQLKAPCSWTIGAAIWEIRPLKEK